MVDQLPLLHGGEAFTAELMGWSPARALAEWRSGRVRRLWHGVYIDARVPDTLEIMARGLMLVVPPDAVVGYSTAALLFGVDVHTGAERHRGLQVHVLTPTDRTPPHRPGVVGHEVRLSPAEVTVVHGVRVTTPTRTTADLLRILRPTAGLGAADAMAHLGLTTSGDVLAALAPLVGFRNIRRARLLAPLIDPDAESFGESALRYSLVEAGMPRPTAQIPLRDRNGNIVYRLDLGWPEVKLAIEYDGRQYHSEAERLADMARREEIARRFGWTVIVVRAEDVFGLERAYLREVARRLGRPAVGA